VNRVYLDGYNFILRNPTLSRIFKGDNQMARERLKSILQEYAARRKVKITVVYDSEDKTPGQGTVTSGYLYEEVFVRDADSYLRQMMDRSQGRDEHALTIVSSDFSDVILPAKGRGVRVLTSEEFNEDLKRTISKEQSESEKPSPPDKEELEDWMRYFGEGEE
jgi:predicted RNA-binding protein with PIN domain